MGIRLVVPLIVAIILIGLLLVAALSKREIQQIIISSPTPTPPAALTPTSTPTPSPTPTVSSMPTLRPANIRVSSPTPNQIISSPLRISGQAQGFWFFEATAPVRLVDGNGQEIAVSFITAEGDWMTENFVPFSGQLTFSPPATNTGQLILERSNPSGLPQNAQQITIPVRFR